MENIKNAILNKEDSFLIDPSFTFFQSYFQDLSKEQALKMLLQLARFSGAIAVRAS